MREAARQHTQARTRHPASPKLPPQKTPKTASKTPPQDTFILRHVHNIKHQNTQRYALQSSQSQMQARNLAHETIRGPTARIGSPSLSPPNPPPPIHATASDQKAKKSTRKASFHLRNNDRIIAASSSNETTTNEAATEADGAAAGPAKRVTGMIGEPDMILR
jgi:hypothetical protein